MIKIITVARDVWHQFGERRFRSMAVRAVSANSACHQNRAR